MAVTTLRDEPRAAVESRHSRHHVYHSKLTDARWDEFQARYRAELVAPERAKALDALAEHARRGPLTLVYGARDTEHNQAQVIAEEIERRLDVDPTT